MKTPILNIENRGRAVWTPPAERSGDGAFGSRRGASVRDASAQSGVALRLPPQTKTLPRSDRSSTPRCCHIPIALFVFSLVLSLCLTGCLSRPALVHQTFALQTPAITNTAPATGRVLVLRPVEVSPLFAGQALVYRTGPNAYETDPYAGFLVPPSRALAIPVRAYLANSGAFADVVEPGSLLTAGQQLQVYVTELYGDFRQPAQPAAVLSLRMVLATAEGNVILQKVYSRSMPLQKNTATAVVAGYDQALAGIMADFSADWAAGNTGAVKPGNQ